MPDLGKNDVGLDDDNYPAGFLLGAFSLIGAVLTLLGVSGGTVGRMVRNESTLTIVGFFAAALAVLLGVLAGVLKRHKSSQGRVLVAGIAFVLIALGATILAAVRVWSDRPAPNVAVSVTSTGRGDLLRLAVKDSGLRSSERLDLKVWPVLGESYTVSGDGSLVGDPSYATGPLPLYQDVLGPDADGDVEASPHALLPLGHAPRVVVDAAVGNAQLSDCTEESGEAGCVILNLGNSAPPQLRMNWSARRRDPLLRMSVSARELGPSALHTLVIGIRPGLHRRLAAGILAPGPAGSIKQRVQVPVPPVFGQVCAAISPVAVTSCPPTGARMPGVELPPCVKGKEKERKSNEASYSVPELEQSCRREYARHILEVCTWQRMRTPD